MSIYTQKLAQLEECRRLNGLVGAPVEWVEPKDEPIGRRSMYLAEADYITMKAKELGISPIDYILGDY